MREKKGNVYQSVYCIIYKSLETLMFQGFQVAETVGFEPKQVASHCINHLYDRIKYSAYQAIFMQS